MTVPPASLETTFDEFRSPGVLGILYAEDFGEEPPPPPEPEPEPDVPPITAEDVEAACGRAVAAAEAAWAHGAAERRSLALQQVAAGLLTIRREAAAQAEAVADALVRAALATVAGALPHLCRAHGPGEVAALLQEVVPVLAPRGRVVVRVHAELLPVLEKDLGRLPDGMGDAVELLSANLPPGDARITWEGGSLVRDSQAMCTALTEGLARLGLLSAPVQNPPTQEAPVPERSLAHAE